MTKSKAKNASHRPMWLRVLFLGVALMMAPIRASAQQTKDVMITGEIVDLSCYIKMGALGMDHKECAIGCAKAGMPVAILEDMTGKLFTLVSEKELESVNIKIQPLEKFVAQKSITIKGKLYEKAGQQLLEVISVGKGK